MTDQTLLPPRDYAEYIVVEILKTVEQERKRQGMSMRALAKAAGMRPTSYWAILRKPKGVKAVTLFSLLRAACAPLPE